MAQIKITVDIDDALVARIAAHRAEVLSAPGSQPDRDYDGSWRALALRRAQRAAEDAVWALGEPDARPRTEAEIEARSTTIFMRSQEQRSFEVV